MLIRGCAVSGLDLAQRAADFLDIDGFRQMTVEARRFGTPLVFRLSPTGRRNQSRMLAPVGGAQ